MMINNKRIEIDVFFLFQTFNPSHLPTYISRYWFMTNN